MAFVWFRANFFPDTRRVGHQALSTAIRPALLRICRTSVERVNRRAQASRCRLAVGERVAPVGTASRNASGRRKSGVRELGRSDHGEEHAISAKTGAGPF